jgi:hypothetical protein
MSAGPVSTEAILECDPEAISGEYLKQIQENFVKGTKHFYYIIIFVHQLVQ